MMPHSQRLVDAIVKKAAPDVEEEPGEEERDVPEGRLAAAEDIMDVLNSYGASSPGENASKVEKATAEAARRAKAKILDEALAAWFDQYDAGE